MVMINKYKILAQKEFNTDDGQMEYVKVIHSATQNILHEERKVQSTVKEIGETVQINDVKIK